MHVCERENLEPKKGVGSLMLTNSRPDFCGCCGICSKHQVQGANHHYGFLPYCSPHLLTHPYFLKGRQGVFRVVCRHSDR